MVVFIIVYIFLLIVFTSVFQGRQTDHVLAAAVYIAWVAEEPTTRLKAKLQTFFKKNSANCSNIKVTRLRYAELVQIICKLAKVNEYCELCCLIWLKSVKFKFT